MATKSARERLRQSFRPIHVQVLFVGEAPPAGAGFFYEPDSSRHKVVQRVFEKAFDCEFEEGEFLRWFARAGCYLEDLSHDPVDDMMAAERKALYERGVERLAATLAELRPAVVVALLKRIAPAVRSAIADGRLGAEFVEVPYPSRWAGRRGF